MGRKKRRGTATALRDITVFSSPREPHRGLVRCGALALQCALGRSGVARMKREGDGATPAGSLKLLSLIVRPDRMRPRSAVPMRVLRKDDGWCEAPRHGSYNRPIRLPPSAGHDSRCRDDHLYDVIGVLDGNTSPPVSAGGSATFLHLAPPAIARPTAASPSPAAI